MNQYDYDDHKNDTQDTIAGYLLVLLMLALVTIMIYSIIESWRNPVVTPYTPPTTGTATGTTVSPSDVAAASPQPTTSPKPTPMVESPEVTQSSPLPSSTTESSPTPEPKPSKTKKFPGRFYGAPPDGPPSLKREYGDMFEGVSGKAYITIYSKVFEGSRVYLINEETRSYYSLNFEKKGPGVYQAEIPPGKFSLKITKSGYFTFKTSLPYLEDGLSADIREPLVKRPYLDIRSRPSCAKIYINGLYAGETPKLIKNLDATEYTIKLVKPGYYREQFEMSFEKGRGQTRTVKLYPK